MIATLPDFKRYGHKAAGVLLVRGDGSVLAIKRADGRGLGLPFGKAESSEDAETTARRELLEETGLFAWSSLIYLYEANGNVAYRTGAFIGEIRATDEGQPVWVEPTELVQPENAFADFNRAALLRAGLIQE
jgi:8-oxo-dGTP pyrophosphatase MutT (NUDIX family)